MKKLLATALISAVSVIGIIQPANANRITPERRYVNQVNNTLIQEGFIPMDELTLLEYGQSLCQLKRVGYSIFEITFSIINNNQNQAASPEQLNAGRRTLILAGAAAESILCP